MTKLTTEVNYLRPIDREGLIKFAEFGKANPNRVVTNKVKTVMQGVYRSWSFIGLHNPVIVDEPVHLLGENTAPAPVELLLSALGGCLGVGITAVATLRNVKLSKLELHLEGDIGNSAAWGTAATSWGENAEKRVEVETAIADLKKALEGTDLAAIKSATEKTSELSQQLGAALYAANAATAEAPQADDGVQDAEIVEESK